MTVQCIVKNQSQMWPGCHKFTSGATLHSSPFPCSKISADVKSGSEMEKKPAFFIQSIWASAGSPCDNFSVFTLQSRTKSSPGNLMRPISWNGGLTTSQARNLKTQPKSRKKPSLSDVWYRWNSRIEIPSAYLGWMRVVGFFFSPSDTHACHHLNEHIHPPSLSPVTPPPPPPPPPPLLFFLLLFSPLLPLPFLLWPVEMCVCADLECSL